METLTLFYLENCPYCRNARAALEALRSRDPAYGTVEVALIEESRQPELADRYDYFRVPTIFAGEEKLYEARPFDSYEVIEANVRAALDRALGRDGPC